MKLTFTFTNEPDLFNVPKYDVYKTSFELPNQALELSDCEDHLLTIVQGVAQLTHAHLHVSCKDIGWKNKPIELEAIDDGVTKPRLSTKIGAIGFSQYAGYKPQYRILRIIKPVKAPIDNQLHRLGRFNSLNRSLFHLKNFNLQETEYGKIVEDIQSNILFLLHTEPVVDFFTDWKFAGIYPDWWDNRLVKKLNNRHKEAEKAQKKAEREAKKRAEQEAKGKKPRKGQIYFIQQGEDGPIKIGYSTNPEKRLKTLNTASPYPLKLLHTIIGGKNLEKELHARFAYIQLDGEWFEASPELIDYIETLKTE